MFKWLKWFKASLAQKCLLHRTPLKWGKWWPSDVGTQSSQQLYSSVVKLQNLLGVVHSFVAGGDVSVCLCCSYTSYFSVVPTVFRNGNVTSSLCHRRVLWLGTVFELPPSHSTLPAGIQALVAASIVQPESCEHRDGASVLLTSQ